MKKSRRFTVRSSTAVAYQGEQGAFSQRAAHQIFGRNIRPLACVSFDAVFEALEQGKARLAVIPIENSLAGSIHQVFDLLIRHSFDAIGETYVRIEHNLIVHPGVRRSQIRQVFSHPVALAQCQKFLKSVRGVEVVPFYDTAGSVKHISEKCMYTAAAIASEDAARIYGMRILRRGVEDNCKNFTRFLALAPRGKYRHGGDKTTVVFGLRNEPGALFKALSVFALRNIDMTKIESRPIHGKPWEYLFYVDLHSDIRSHECANALRHLQEMTLYFQIIGSYPSF